MAKTFSNAEAGAGLLQAITMVSKELLKPKEQQDEARAARLALAEVSVVLDSDNPVIAEVEKYFDIPDPLETAETAIEQIAAPPIGLTDEIEGECPF